MQGAFLGFAYKNRSIKGSCFKTKQFLIPFVSIGKAYKKVGKKGISCSYAE